MASCAECGKELNSEEGLLQHRQSKHDAPQSKNVTPSTASKKFIIKKKYYWYAGIIASVLLLTAWSYYSSNAPGKYDGLARCLGEKGVTFYGTFWCPHCQEQKQLFGNSAKLLPYVECSTPNGKAQTPICSSRKIEGYPTWEFADGSRVSGVMKLADLADKTGCEID